MQAGSRACSKRQVRIRPMLDDELERAIGGKLTGRAVLAEREPRDRDALRRELRLHGRAAVLALELGELPLAGEQEERIGDPGVERDVEVAAVTVGPDAWLEPLELPKWRSFSLTSPPS